MAQQPIVRLTPGTIEQVVVELAELLGNLTSLAGVSDLQFDLVQADPAETAVITDEPCVYDGMKALPLIDTTGLDEGDYNLYIHFSVLPETPRLGPFKLRLDD